MQLMGESQALLDVLYFETQEEPLDNGVIPRVVAVVHARPDAVIGQQPLPGVAGVLAALVGVQQQPRAGGCARTSA